MSRSLTPVGARWAVLSSYCKNSRLRRVWYRLTKMFPLSVSTVGFGSSLSARLCLLHRTVHHQLKPTLLFKGGITFSPPSLS